MTSLPIRISAIVAAAFFWCAYFAADARATSVLPIELDQIVASAQHIAHVRCVSNTVEADPNVRVVTVSTFVVLDRAKGAPGATFTVRQVGGELNGVVIDYHLPTFKVGEEYVLFMPPASRLGLASPVGLAQGVFNVMPGRAGKEVGNGRDFAALMPHANAATLPPRMAARMQRPEGERRQIDLADFMTVVRARAGR